MTPESALILANFEKAAVRELASEVEAWLAERLEVLGVVRDIRGFAAERELDPSAGVASRPDLLVVLGGDGALLGAVRAFSADPVPTVGINLGHVGFLASTPAPRWLDTLEHVLAGTCEVEERSRVEARWRDRDGVDRSAIALNDIGVQRGTLDGMVRASLSIDGVFVTKYRADGILVATPSGSTAYSLSAGGPILVPGVGALVVTPVSSQGLSNRPIVVPADGVLGLSVEDGHGHAQLAVDGQRFFALRDGDVVELRRDPVPYPLFAMPGLDPYRRLRERLGWGSEQNPAPPGS